MTLPPIERKLRSGLRVLRLVQVYMPLWVARWAEKRAAVNVHVPDDITYSAVSADGVRCEWFTPQDSPQDQVLLYLHGGGFVFGLSDMHRDMVVSLARRMSTRVLMVDYRLAPENPFPAPLDDCVTAYRWLLKQGIPAHRIVIAGDSAGGNLTLTLLMRLRDSSDPLPAAAACLSPVTDLSGKGEFLTDFHDPLLHPKAARFYNTSYVAHNDPHNPLISPVLGDWHGLPPLLIHAGEDEILRHDAIRAEALAREAGVEVRLEIYPRMWHVWQLYPTLPQTSQSLDDIARFLTLQLAAQRSPA